MIQTQENGEKRHFGPNSWAPWDQIQATIFFFKSLALLLTSLSWSAIIMYNIRKN